MTPLPGAPRPGQTLAKKFTWVNWGKVTWRLRPGRATARPEGRAAHSSRYTASDPSFSQTSTFETRTRSPSVSAIFRFASS